MTDYKKILDDNLKEQAEMGIELNSKLEYLGSIVFNFITYDGGMDELFAKNMLEVIEVILNGKTFDYISNDKNYLNYLQMVNSPFLRDKLEWGTSIRGAWFDNDKQYDFDCERIIIQKGELSNFIKDLIEWSKA